MNLPWLAALPQHPLIHSKATWLAMGVTLLLALTDFATRVYIPSTSAANNAPAVMAALHMLPRVTPEQQQALLQQFTPYDAARRAAQAATAAKTEEIPDINSQQGRLQQLYTDTAKLNLVAIIDAGAPFALLARTERQDNRLGFIRLHQGESVDGFTLSQINETSVALSRGEQSVTLLMYKTQDNAHRDTP